MPDQDPRTWGELWRYARADRARFFRLLTLIGVGLAVVAIWCLVLAAASR